MGCVVCDAGELTVCATLLRAVDREVLADIQSMKDEVEIYTAQVADPAATSVNLAGRVVFDMAVMTRFVESLWLAQSLHTLRYKSTACVGKRGCAGGTCH